MTEVFVFGSNGLGFHGAGAAGYAFLGDAQYSWRDSSAFQKALKAPAGHPDRVGHSAILGVARGFQRGKKGYSYAIETCTKPGARRSVPLSEIEKQMRELIDFANEHPDMTFLITAFGTGYAGYSRQEINEIWSRLNIPSSFKFI